MKIARLALVAVFGVGTILCSWLAPMDKPALEQVDGGLKRALISFAAARTLNGVISLVQGTQVAVQPFGIGVTLSLGQILTPVNELAKHFADLMLAASIAFGIQRVLIAIGGNWLISLVLSVVVLGWSYYVLRRLPPPSILSRTLLILLMVRFAMPMVFIGTALLSDSYLSADYTASQNAITASSKEVEVLTSTVSVTSNGNGILGKLGVPSYDELKASFERLKRAAASATEHIIKIMVFFLLQTFIIPVLLLWGLYAIARGAVELPRRGNIAPVHK